MNKYKIDKLSYDDQLKEIKRNGNNIMFIENPSEEMQLLSVNTNYIFYNV